MNQLYIKKKSVAEIPKATGSVSDTLNVEDKVTNAPSINLVTKISGIPEEGIIAYEGDDIPEGYEETTNPITAIADILFPIGRGFLDFTDTDYSNWLGLTWERELVGMTPIGKDANDTDFATVGQKGGEKKHTLSVDEMPRHSHAVAVNGDSNYPLVGGGGQDAVGHSIFSGGASNTNNGSWPINTINTGGSQPHNIMQPYQVVSYWKRVDPNAKTMISFTMYGITYQAEEGMTFKEWINSSYNIDGWSYYSETSPTLYNPRGNIIDYADIVASAEATDVIEANKTYSTYIEK